MSGAISFLDGDGTRRTVSPDHPLPVAGGGGGGGGEVEVTNFPAVQPVNGTVNIGNLPATQPVSAAALPLPAGASTAALQTTLNTALGTAAKTPTYIRAVAAGTVAAGAKMVSIKNVGTAEATVLGTALPVGEVLTWETVSGTIGAIAYVASATAILAITELR